MLEELQALLRGTHLTIREIATETRLSMSLISAIKSGDKPNPTIETYQALRDCLVKAKCKSAPKLSKRAA